MCPPLQLLSSHDSLGCQDFVSRDSYPKLVPRVIRVSQKAKLSYEQFQNAIFGDLEYVRILQYYLQLTRGISSRGGGGGGGVIPYISYIRDVPTQSGYHFQGSLSSGIQFHIFMS